MKKHILLLIFSSLILLLLVNACSEEDLEVKNASPVQDQYFQESVLSYEEAVFATYQKLLFFHNYRGGNYLHEVRLFPDDDLTTDRFAPFEIFSPINSGNGDVGNYYQFAYQLINRANVILDNLALYGDEVFEREPDTRRIIEGEARFLRAFMYFRLQDFFGTPPLVTQQITDISFRPSNSAEGEVLDFVIEELQLAAELLPDSWDAANKGRVTSGSAYGLLGKALMVKASNESQNTKLLTDAIAAFDAAEAAGHELVANWGDNFAGGEAENNAESLFEIQFGQNRTNNVWLNNDQFAFVGDLSGYWGFYERHWSLFGNPPMLPTESLMNAFEEGDPRRDLTFRDGLIVKYVDGGVKGNAEPGYLNNARVIRLADILLLKAEAKLFTGAPAEAVELVNRIRERARNITDPASTVPADFDTGETDEDTIFNWIMEERRRELAGEQGWRWHDLKRWHRAGLIDLSNWDFSSNLDEFNFDVNTHLLLPFPSAEVAISNGGLVQNPGY